MNSYSILVFFICIFFSFILVFFAIYFYLANKFDDEKEKKNKEKNRDIFTSNENLNFYNEENKYFCNNSFANNSLYSDNGSKIYNNIRCNK
jgi:hypothetical protein